MSNEFKEPAKFRAELEYSWKKGEYHIKPKHHFVKHWGFKENEESEASLANMMAEVAEKNGLSANDVMHLFPYVLRMLKSDIAWAK